MPPAPVTFSTITCWPSSSDRRGASARAITSVAPPAPNGTTMVSGRDGQLCAAAGALATSAATAVISVSIPPLRRAADVAAGLARVRRHIITCVVHRTTLPTLGTNPWEVTHVEDWIWGGRPCRARRSDGRPGQRAAPHPQGYLARDGG